MSVTRQLNLCQDARFIFKSYSSSLPYIYYKVTVLVYPKNKLYLINKAHSSLLYYLYCLWNSIKDLFSFKPPFFFSESGCKGKKFIIYLPNNFGSFFSFFLLCSSLCERKEENKKLIITSPTLQIIQGTLLSFSKAGAKVEHLNITAKHYNHFFWTFFNQNS